MGIDILKQLLQLSLRILCFQVRCCVGWGHEVEDFVSVTIFSLKKLMKLLQLRVVGIYRAVTFSQPGYSAEKRLFLFSSIKEG